MFPLHQRLEIQSLLVLYPQCSPQPVYQSQIFQTVTEMLKKCNVSSKPVGNEESKLDDLESKDDNRSSINDDNDYDNNSGEGNMANSFSERSDSDEDQYEKNVALALMLKLEELPSLKFQVRTFLRRNLNLFSPSSVDKLPLPKSLREFVLCWDLKAQQYEINSFSD